jgi:hypothetical protein
MRKSFILAMPDLPGQSGSPIFSAKTHELLGLAWTTGMAAENPRWSDRKFVLAYGTRAVPLRAILAELTEKAKNGKLSARLRNDLAQVVLP